MVKLETMTYVTEEPLLAPTPFYRNQVIHVCAPHTIKENIASESVMQTNLVFVSNPPRRLQYDSLARLLSSITSSLVTPTGNLLSTEPNTGIFLWLESKLLHE